MRYCILTALLVVSCVGTGVVFIVINGNGEEDRSDNNNNNNNNNDYDAGSDVSSAIGSSYMGEDNGSNNDNDDDIDGVPIDVDELSSLNNSPGSSIASPSQPTSLFSIDTTSSTPTSSSHPTHEPTTTSISIATDSSSSSSSSTTANPLLTFYAIGDVPYSDMEACLLPHELRKLSSSASPLSSSSSSDDDDDDNDAKFLIHLGDIQDGRSESCPKTLYQNIATIFEHHSPLPTLFVIGDNEWLDCENGNAANESFAYWEEYLLPFHERQRLIVTAAGNVTTAATTTTTTVVVPPLDANVTRHPDHPEIYSFAIDGVLFLGQGLPWPHPENTPNDDEWRKYLMVNANWTRERLIEYINDNNNNDDDDDDDEYDNNSNNNNNIERGGTKNAVVILAHAAPEPYFAELKSIASSHAQIPILFLEDYHHFEEETYSDIPNLYRIALDDTVTPTSITVDITGAIAAARAVGSGSGSGSDGRIVVTDVFRYDRRCPCSSGHRPTKLISLSKAAGEECEGVCDTNDLCDGENVCGMDGAMCW